MTPLEEMQINKTNTSQIYLNRQNENVKRDKNNY